jgi:hypothetical protein
MPVVNQHLRELLGGDDEPRHIAGFAIGLGGLTVIRGRSIGLSLLATSPD